MVDHVAMELLPSAYRGGLSAVVRPARYLFNLSGTWPLRT